MTPPPVLKLGALKWISDGPFHRNAPDEHRERLGTYVIAFPPTGSSKSKSQHLLLDICTNHDSDLGEGKGEDYICYAPRPGYPRSFLYERKALVDCKIRGWDESDAIFNEVNEQGPRFSLCLPDEELFPFSFTKQDGYEQAVENRPPGPPFRFYLGDVAWGAGQGPEDVLSPTLICCEPELPGQRELSPFGSDSDDEWLPYENDEGDTFRSEGWRGPWARELIAKYKNGEYLGETTATAWRNWDAGWGLKLRFEPVKISSYKPELLDDEDDVLNYATTDSEGSGAGKDSKADVDSGRSKADDPGDETPKRYKKPPLCIDGYTVRVTVDQVLVKQSFVEWLGLPLAHREETPYREWWWKQKQELKNEDNEKDQQGAAGTADEQETQRIRSHGEVEGETEADGEQDAQGSSRPSKKQRVA